MAGDLNNNNVEKKVSRINSAGLINSTLERLWLDSYNAMARGNYLLWNIKLDSIWAILGGDVKEDDNEEKAFVTLNGKIGEVKLQSKLGSGFDKKSNPDNSTTYQHLLKKAIFLRRLQNTQGKGTAYDSGDDFDID